VEKSATAEAGNIEVRPLDLGQDFWNLGSAPTLPPLVREERRAAPRFACHGSISFRSEQEGFNTVAAAVTDLSRSGCYVELLSTLPVGTMLSFTLHLDEFTLSGAARVATSHPGVGMGLMFCDLGEGDRSIVRQLLRQLSGAAL
jgi:hypothetical protein